MRCPTCRGPGHTLVEIGYVVEGGREHLPGPPCARCGGSGELGTCATCVHWNDAGRSGGECGVDGPSLGHGAGRVGLWPSTLSEGHCSRWERVEVPTVKVAGGTERQ